MKITVDTSALVNYLKDIEDNINKYDFILPSTVVEELDNLNKSDNFDKSYKARKALRFIEKNIDRFEYIICDDSLISLPNHCERNKNDNIILSVAKNTNSSLFCRDRNLKLKAKVLGVEICDFHKDIEKYYGYKIVKMSDKEVADFYEGKFDYKELNLFENQYLIIENNERYIDKYKMKDGNLEKIKVKRKIKVSNLGDLKPRDVFQEIALDSLYEDNFTLLTGHAGTAKSLLSLTYAMNQIEEGKRGKLIIFTNPIKARGTSNLGFYSGNRTEKLMQNSIGSMLSSKFGGSTFGINTLIDNETIQIYSMSDIRGMEISSNDILYITESQNMTLDTAKLCLQRVKDGSKIILEGDIDTQLDSAIFENGNNGILNIMNTFKGESCFSYVELQNIYRSEIARIADKM